MGSDSVTDDNDVVKKVLSGDREAYRVLVDKYGSRVVAFCRSRMRSEEDAAMPPRTCFSAPYSSLASFRRRELRRLAFRDHGNHVRTRFRIFQSDRRKTEAPA